MDAVRTEEERVQAFKEEWVSEIWLRLCKPDMEAEWERHFNELDLSLAQFTGKVLDIGCGASGAIYYLPNASRRVGIDPAAEAVERWNGPVNKGRHAIELVAGGGENIGFDDAYFDSVFCINCLDHTTNPTAVVHEIHRILKPRGRFVLQFDIDSPLRKLHKLVRPVAALMHPHSFDYEWVDRFILSSGLFRIERTSRDLDTFRGPDAKKCEAYWDDLIYRATGWKRFIHHLWIAGTKV